MIPKFASGLSEYGVSNRQKYMGLVNDRIHRLIFRSHNGPFHECLFAQLKT
jgi:hypothetical protein